MKKLITGLLLVAALGIGSFAYYSMYSSSDSLPPVERSLGSPDREEIKKLLNHLDYDTSTFRTEPSAQDKKLQRLLEQRNVTPIKPPESKPSPEKMRLGRWLYWDKELSGARDVSCGHCHTPVLGTSDGLSLSIGSGSRGDSINRRLSPGQEFVPRNALHLYNRAPNEWRTVFWDNRIQESSTGGIVSPLSDKLPQNVEDILSAQVMMTASQRREMRGRPGTTDIFGRSNELAEIPPENHRKIWSRLTERILSHKTYREYFKKVYPEVSRSELNFGHAASAISTYVKVAFTRVDSPWNLYLLGDYSALSKKQKRGAKLFYGKANCSACHSGKLTTDQKPHNIGVPQLGPGVKPYRPDDLGHYGVTEKNSDKFTFRTPSLFNVGLTGPWMHNGAFKSLEMAVKHHFNPRKSFLNYNARQLDRDIQAYHRSPKFHEQLKAFPLKPPGKSLRPTVRNDRVLFERMSKTLDSALPTNVDLSDREFDQLMAFLKSLTNPAYVRENVDISWQRDAFLTQNRRQVRARLTPYVLSTIPDTVPSGIPIDCKAEWCMP